MRFIKQLKIIKIMRLFNLHAFILWSMGIVVDSDIIVLCWCIVAVSRYEV